ncbi:DinB family protein [Cellulomonas fimi]|uniref:DinB family protein n=1 Tax=Cellulomonas fimi TaxID=1708 RepID=A0A7Y0LXZ3_CELFI|nr:DinB family protein [Cellulomonas fimi]NMR20045.1 DinB family protein [Cellulomonas fimi]
MTDAPSPHRTAPAPPAADTKDWTWVLERPCPECGFVAADVAVDDIGPAVRDLVPRWRAALARPDVRDRPRPQTWSVLEYGAHVRDVNHVFAGRLAAMLDDDDPQFADWDQDAAALAGEYWSQDPARVADELATAALALADLFDAVPADALDRPGRRSNGSRFTVRTLGQYYLHDVVHHTHDVGA